MNMIEKVAVSIYDNELEDERACLWEDLFNDEKIQYRRQAKAVSKTIVSYFEDHYWDSLEQNKDIVMLHVRAMFGIEK